ncbi:MAG TPA: cyclic nucleotide-binding domain-containing protein [Albitalea sp.]|nr:cyclic nucleotide-binding domain-containing protein [Albitalea sp.]
MPQTRIELLQAMPIFGAIRDDVLAFLLEQAQIVRVAAGDYFFREGDAGQAMFVLESGRAAVLKNWEGRKYLLHQFRRGDCFGEMALMDLMPRSASVKALEDCTAIELRPEHLMSLYQRDIEQFALIQMNIGREVSRRLRATDERLFAAEMSAEPQTIVRAQRPPAGG